MIRQDSRDSEKLMVETGGKFVTLINIANIVFQTNALLNPYSTKHQYMNLFYCFCTLVSLVSVWYGLKHKRNYMILIAYQIMLFRNIFRLMDLEDTYEHMSTYEYLNLMIM